MLLIVISKLFLVLMNDETEPNTNESFDTLENNKKDGKST
jgi:hypothetical protein